MFRVAINPLIIEDTKNHSFSLYSLKQEGSTECSKVESSWTTFDPMRTKIIVPLQENSPYLDMAVNQHRCTDARLDSMMEEVQNVELNDENESMSIWNTNKNLCWPEIDKEARMSRSVSALKYLQGFGSEPTGSILDEAVPMKNSKNPRQTDTCFASPSDSSFSISSSRSSLSPTKELGNIVSSENSAQTCEKGVPVKSESRRARCTQKSNTHGQDHGQKMDRKKNRQYMRGNRFQRESKQTNLRTDTGKRKYRAHKHQNGIISSCRRKAKNEYIRVCNNISPARKICFNNTESCKRGDRNRLGREISTTVFTLGDALKMLMNKPNMLLAFVTDKEGSRFLQEHLISARADQLWSTFTHLKRHFVTVSQDVYGN